MGFTFDAPISATRSAYERAYRPKSKVSLLPARAVTASIAATSSPNSFLDKASQHIRNPFRRSSTPAPSIQSSNPSSAAARPSKPVPAAESPFFRLPLELRETIYGLVVGRREMLHIMMKRRPNRLLHPLVHRRCRAGGNLDDCILKDCKRFLAEGGQGSYYGSFSNVGGLLFSCRAIFQEVSALLYTQNVFEFDHPLSLMIFQKTIHSSSLNSIKSISINLQRDLYNPARPEETSILMRLDVWPDVWPDMWDIIAGMEGLEEIRVRFRFPLNGWLSWSERKVLDPLWMVTRPMRVFEVESRTAIDYKADETAKAPFKLVENWISA